MTTDEFSNTLDTMLSSYSNQAMFGEQASKADIVLDEYEKSVILTQAQDIVVKSYFDARLNNEGAGFDDTTKRQIDFSSLITVKDVEPEATQSGMYDSRGILYKMPLRVGTSMPDPLFILNEKVVANQTSYSTKLSKDVYGAFTAAENDVVGHLKAENKTDTPVGITFIAKQTDSAKNTGLSYTADFVDGRYEVEFTYRFITADIHTVAELENEYVDIKLSINYSFSPTGTDTTMVSEEVTSEEHTASKEYTVVPMNYKEYDRMMSKPYSQPLKKQAWRLFQNQVAGFDTLFELIPKFNVVETDPHLGSTELTYKVRYVRRPVPIVLEDLPDGLSVDGESNETQCELHPSIHIEILNKAVELALATRGGRASAAPQQREVRQE